MTFGGKDNRGPSIAELQRYIREKVPMCFKLATGEEVHGVLRWFDEHAFSVQPDGEQPFTILRSAVVGYRKQNGDAPKAAPAANSRESGTSSSDQSAETGDAAESQS